MSNLGTAKGSSPNNFLLKLRTDKNLKISVNTVVGTYKYCLNYNCAVYWVKLKPQISIQWDSI